MTHDMINNLHAIAWKFEQGWDLKSQVFKNLKIGNNKGFGAKF